MKIEVGKSYRCRDGHKVTIVRTREGRYPFDAFTNDTPTWGRTYTEDGRFLLEEPSHRNDIVAEWTEPESEPSPFAVKTVTKYVLPDGREFGTREEAEAAHRLTELAQKIYDNTDAEREASESVAEYLLRAYTLTPK